MEAGKIEKCDKEVGHALFVIASKLNPAYNHRVPILLKYAIAKKLVDAHQIDRAIEFIKEKGDLDLTEKELETQVWLRIRLIINNFFHKKIKSNFFSF